jgi:CHAT domain-containing protein/lipopolysaccharide biosynthesis regulator YciM
MITRTLPMTVLLALALLGQAWPAAPPSREKVAQSKLVAERDRLLKQANLYEQREQFAEALAARKEVLRVIRALHGPGDWRTADAQRSVEDCRRLPEMDAGQRRRLQQAVALTRRVAQLWRQGKPKEALPLAEKALAARREVLGEKHPDYTESLNNLALIHESMANYATAVPLMERCRDLTRAALGENHPTYATRLNNLAWLYRSTGDYARALPLYEQALDIRKTTLGPRHSLYAQSLHNLGGLLSIMGDYARALPMLEEALTLRKAALGEKHINYVHDLSSLGAVYVNTGEYPRALALLKQARDTSRAIVGEEHAEYAHTLQNLANVYWRMGAHVEALPLYERARDVYLAALGKKHPYYARCLNNLGMLYRDMGDSARALSLIRQAHDLFRTILGEKHPEYAVGLQNLASLYQRMRDYDRALPLLERAREVYEAVLGKKHPDYAQCLHELAVVHLHKGDNARALSLMEQALDIRKEALGPRHPYYARSLANLAALHVRLGNHGRALKLAEQARDIYRPAVGEKHPAYADTLETLAYIYLARNDSVTAERLLHEVLTIRRQYLEDSFTALSERQRLDLLAQQRSDVNNYFTAAIAAKTPAPRLYEQVLAWKGIVTALQAEERLALDEPALAGSFNELRLARAGLAKLAAETPAPGLQQQWRQRFDELEEKKERLEVKLAAASKSFRRLRLQATAEQVAGALPADTALIDFLHYSHARPDSRRQGPWLTEEHLLAFVLARGRPPICVPLGPIARIDDLITDWRAPLTAAVPASPSPAVAAELRRLLWLPVEKHLKDGQAVLIAPDGMLCSLPLAALPGSKPGSYLVEERAIGYVTSGRHLLEVTDTGEHRPVDGLLSVGGLAYGKGERRLPASSGIPRLPACADLPGTRLEIERVNGLYRDTFPAGRASRQLDGNTCDKAAFQAALRPEKDHPRWRYLHLATHGYFERPRSAVPAEALAALTVGDFSAGGVGGALQGLSVLLTAEEPGALNSDRTLLDLSGQRQRTLGRNPQLLCGLALSGANTDTDAGLLSAAEVARLDLRGCELVVLSACDTGLGKFAGSEGMLGLQRAFLSAGAGATLCTLWSISDAATSVLMEQFYSNLWQKKTSRLEALRQAQITVLRNPALVEARLVALRAEAQKRGLAAAGDGWRKLEREASPLPFGGKREGKTAPTRSGPAFWGGFVLFGDWR